MSLKEKLQAYLLDRLSFSTMTYRPFTDDMRTHFEGVYNQLCKGEYKRYSGPYPLHLLLHYLITEKELLVHGSNLSDITTFEPRRQTLFNGKPVTAVFASSDGIWSLFFAVVNRLEYEGSLKNLCILIGDKRYYYFSLNRDWSGPLWREGTIYLLPRCSFTQGGAKAEWVSTVEVEPIVKLNVSPEDFIFRNQVKRHNEQEPHWRAVVKGLFLARS
ncbi:hypothetical protein [Bacillus sp. JCM 19034]|uniref:hypothetical protein n=1 Tax=Bacillus sp. JCM 19034 TaxID=1481928 RepID=UPI000784548B|nr:hypothetical protein [Bacillus sp. JCM 19034]